MKKIFMLSALTFLAFLNILAFSPMVSAQNIKGKICEGTAGACEGEGPGLFGEGGIVRNVINILLFIIGIIAVIMLIVGAIRYVTSGGDPNSTKGAKDTILYAIIGIVVAFAAFAIVNFVISGID